MSPVVGPAAGSHIHHPHHDQPSYSMLFSPAASSLASTPGGSGLILNNSVINNPNSSSNNLNNNTGRNHANNPADIMELNWDPRTVRKDLMQAAAILNHRGLKLAAKWASEQLVGVAPGIFADTPTTLADDDKNDENDGNGNDDNDLDNDIAIDKDQASTLHRLLQQEWMALSGRDWYAKSLMDLGEYLHAASALSRPSDHATHIQGPLPDLTSFGFYIRAYSLYMAGERRKEEEYLELQRYVMLIQQTANAQKKTNVCVCSREAHDYLALSLLFCQISYTSLFSIHLELCFVGGKK